jgi:hypothetical protein
MEKKEVQNIDKQIQEYSTKNSSIYGKNFDKLPFDEKLKLAEQNNDPGLVDVLKEQNKHKMSAEQSGTIGTNFIAATTAMSSAKN